MIPYIHTQIFCKTLFWLVAVSDKKQAASKNLLYLNKNALQLDVCFAKEEMVKTAEMLPCSQSSRYEPGKKLSEL